MGWVGVVHQWYNSVVIRFLVESDFKHVFSGMTDEKTPILVEVRVGTVVYANYANPQMPHVVTLSAGGFCLAPRVSEA